MVVGLNPARGNLNIRFWGVVMVVGSNLARGNLFTASIGSVDSLYPIVYTVYIYIYVCVLHVCLTENTMIYQTNKFGNFVVV